MPTSFKIEEEAIVNTIMQWSNFNSGSFNIPGLKGMAALLMQAFSELDCEKSVITLPPIERVDDFGVVQLIELGPLLVFSKRKEVSKKVLLAGHMDTVFDASHPFQKAERKAPNILSGPGVTDMKGGLAIMLEALKIFEKNPKCKDLGWTVLINPDEEIGSLGSAPYFIEQASNHQLGLLFEPAMGENGHLAGERKGSGKFTIIVRGRAAHAGRDFDKGVNAIVAITKLIQKIEQLNGKREKLTLNVGYIRGGGATNVVPDFAICRIDIRTFQVEDEQWISEKLAEIIHSTRQQQGIQVESFGKFTRSPKQITGKTLELFNLVKKLAKDIGQEIDWRPSGGCCDGNNLAQAGLPNVDSLGVSGGHIHSDQEYLLIDSLSKRIELTVAILNHVCCHGF